MRAQTLQHLLTEAKDRVGLVYEYICYSVLCVNVAQTVQHLLTQAQVMVVVACSCICYV